MLKNGRISSVDEIKSDVVLELKELTEKNDIIRMLISRAFDEANGALNNPDINNLNSALIALENNLTYAPECNVIYDNDTKSYIDNSVTTPLALIYGPLAMTESGEALSYNAEMNQWWYKYLTKWREFLDSSDSKYVLADWLKDPAYTYLSLAEYQGQTVDDYKSWNDFFTRQLKLDESVRPTDYPNDNRCITSACDATVWHCAEASDVTINQTFWIKEQPYDIKTLLRNDNTLISRYLNGTMLQTVLFPDDYHRWISPISGKISLIRILGNDDINSNQYNNGNYVTYFSNINYTIPSDDTDLQQWTGAVPYMSHLNVRLLIEIDTTNSKDGNIGKMLFIAVGLNEISSVINEVTEGQEVIKGKTELGKFLYGGSTVIYMFEPNAIKSWTIEKPNNKNNDEWDPMGPGNHQPVVVGQQLFTANLKS